MSSPSTENPGHLIDAGDGTHLHVEHDVATRPRAALLLCHGFAEHAGRYRAFGARLAARGVSVTRFDLRGHGRSEGRRGHVFSFDEYLRDLRAAERAGRERHGASLPWVLASHSNGGLIALHALADEGFARGFAGAVFSSPFFGFALAVPALKRGVARALSNLLPALTLPTGLDASLVSHDPETIREYATDPLIVRVASSRWYTEAVAAHGRLPTLAPRVRLPVLFQQAGDDRIASRDASRTVFDALGSADRTWQEYPGFFHEIWFERERARVEADLDRWLDAHLPT